MHGGGFLENVSHVDANFSQTVTTLWCAAAKVEHTALVKRFVVYAAIQESRWHAGCFVCMFCKTVAVSVLLGLAVPAKLDSIS